MLCCVGPASQHTCGSLAGLTREVDCSRGGREIGQASSKAKVYVWLRHGVRNRIGYAQLVHISVSQ